MDHMKKLDPLKHIKSETFQKGETKLRNPRTRRTVYITQKKKRNDFYSICKMYPDQEDCSGINNYSVVQKNPGL